MLNNITIKKKLLLLAILVGISLFILLVVQSVGIKKVENLEKIAKQTYQAEVDMLTLRRNEKDFMARLDLKYQDQFNENVQGMLAHLLALETQLNDLPEEQKLNQQLIDVINEYQRTFNELVELQTRIGLDSESGLYGSLRKSVHEVEAILEQEASDALLKDMLTLRRNEKDFMLRLDMKYVDRFQGNVDAFRDALNSSFISPAQKSAVRNALSAYEKDFMALVSGVQALGFDSSEGKRAEMRATIHQSESVLADMQNNIQAIIPKQVLRIEIMAIVLSVVLSIVIVGFILMLGRGISRSVSSLYDTMIEANKQRDLSIRASVDSDDEIGHMAKAYNAMTESFQKLINEVITSAQTVSAAAEELSVITGQTSQGGHEPAKQQ